MFLTRLLFVLGLLASELLSYEASIRSNMAQGMTYDFAQSQKSKKGGSMNLTLSLKLRETKIIAGAPIPFTIELTNQGTTAHNLPGLVDFTDVVNYEIYKGDGKLLAVVNGYSNQKLAGYNPTNIPTQLSDLSPGQTWKFDGDLLQYTLPLEPGRYKLRANYRWAPSQMNIGSDPIELVVEPLTPSYLDVDLDDAAGQALYLLYGASLDKKQKMYLRLSVGTTPTAYLDSGVVTEVPIDAQPRFTITNFRSMESFDPAIFRWVVWVEKDQLRAIQTVGGKPEGSPITAATTLNEPRLVWRPVHGKGKDLMAIVFGKTGQGYAADLISLAPDGALQYKETINLGKWYPDPIAAGYDLQDRIYVAWVPKEKSSSEVWLMILNSKGKVVRPPAVLYKAKMPVKRLLVRRQGWNPPLLYIYTRNSEEGRVFGGAKVILNEQRAMTEWPPYELPVKGKISEWRGESYDGKPPHLLIVMADKQLIYANTGKGQHRILTQLSAPGPYFPFLTISNFQEVWAGYFLKDLGYKFIQVDKGIPRPF